MTRSFRGAWLGWGLSFVVAALSVSAAPGRIIWSPGLPPPLHPTVIMSDYKGKTLPIVGVSGDSPEVDVDGKRKSLPRSSKAGFSPVRAARYAPGSLQLRNMQVNSSSLHLILMFESGGEIDNGAISSRSDFTAEVTPTQDYHDCFVALVFFDQEFLEGGSDTPNAFVHFQNIRELVGGKPNKLAIRFGYIDAQGKRLGFFPLFFSNGVEIRSDQCELTARFFRKIEEKRHAAVVRSWVEKHAGATQPPQAYVQIPPIFDDPAALENAPDTVNASFMVSEEGIVQSLQIDGKIPEDVSTVLRRTVSAWLFVPRLKDGRPERTFVKVPIALKTPKPANS